MMLWGCTLHPKNASLVKLLKRVFVLPKGEQRFWYERMGFRVDCYRLNTLSVSIAPILG